MAVKIVTDSSADLPAQLAQQLGITVVPLYVRFGEEVYREQVDISLDQFYHRLEHDPVHPVTIQPGPQDFADVYGKLSKEADGIVSIHISSKLSGTCNAALRGKEMIEGGCPIEVIDSEVITVGLGLICVAAAKAAKARQSLPKVVEGVKQAIPNIHLLCLLENTIYLERGGRIGKAKALLGSALSKINVKPMIALKEGEVVPAGLARSRSKGIERLFDFVKNASNIEDLAVAYNTTPDEAQALADRIGSTVTKEAVKVVRLGTTLGVHMGPRGLAVGLKLG